MKLQDLKIGAEFFSATGRFRCTDIGTRVAMAIRLDQVTVGWLDTETGTRTGKVLTRCRAEKDGWFSGPPYGVVETVFDEEDLTGCWRVPETDSFRKP